MKVDYTKLEIPPFVKGYEALDALNVHYYQALEDYCPRGAIPSFAKPVTLETLNELTRQYPNHSHYCNNPLSVKQVVDKLRDDLTIGKRVPCEWFVLLESETPERYYSKQADLVRQFRPQLLHKRITGCVRNSVLNPAMHPMFIPRFYQQTSLITAKYLRLGNVNDVLCLPPTPNVQANWGCATLTEAIAAQTVKRVWFVEGVKKAQYLMEQTGQYAIAATGCTQFIEGNHLLPTVEWLRDAGVYLDIVTDVDYVSNPDVYHSINKAVKVLRKYDVKLTVKRTLSQAEVDMNTELFDNYSQANTAPEAYGHKTAKGFKFNASGIDDVKTTTGELPMKDITTTAVADNKKPSNLSPKEVVLGFLRLIQSHLAVVIGEETATLYYYDRANKVYCQATRDSWFYRQLMTYCGHWIMNDFKIKNATLFINQCFDELPSVAMLVGDLNALMISERELSNQLQPMVLKGGHTISLDGELVDTDPAVFSLNSVDLSLAQLRESYDRMTQQDWSPLKDLTDRLDVAATARALNLTPYEATKRIAMLEVLMPVTGGSINGSEAIFFQTCCSGAGKTVADQALAKLIGVRNVATNISLDGLVSNRFARYNLKGKTIATASDVNTLTELEETALRNSFGETMVEQKNKRAEQVLLHPVFRFSSNYDKPYSQDVAGAMGRRTIIKRYVKPLLPEAWEDNYCSPVEMYFDLYSALLYEALVINPIGRYEIDKLFQQVAKACNDKAQPIISNTGELVVERGCYYTGDDNDRITMMELHTVAVNLAPLYGIGTAKNALNLHEALKLMEVKHAAKPHLNPIKLEWDSTYKDWALVGYRFDKEWLLMTANDVIKRSHQGAKANAAVGLMSYFKLQETRGVIR